MEDTGIEKIALEREEQLEVHNRTVEKDIALNSRNQLQRAAQILSSPNIGFQYYEEGSQPYGWDLKVWHHMLKKPYVDRLAIAGAFCAAEIDRVQGVAYIVEQARDSEETKEA